MAKKTKKQGLKPSKSRRAASTKARKAAPRPASGGDRYGFALPDFDPEAVVSATTLPVAGPIASPEDLKTSLSAATGQAFSELRPLQLELPRGIEPRLQLALANFQTGKRGPTLSSTANDEVAVIARVTSVEEWLELPDVHSGVVIGGLEEDTDWIVTGRIPLDRLQQVSESEYVIALSAPQAVKSSLDATTRVLQTAQGALPADVRPAGGRGVVVGIVDFGCDFAHQNFLKGGKTRLLALWNQRGITKPTAITEYGRVLSRAEINKALQKSNPYAALGYAPGNEPGGSHGTHVMDIAVGNGNGSGVAGVAPDADIVFVDASIPEASFEGERAVESHFGDSIQLLEAVTFVFNTAGDRPCVCNISLGTNGGPHDGSSLVEQGLDRLVRARPNRAVVVAAGNSQDHRMHTSGEVSDASSESIVWMQKNDGGGEFELWYPGDKSLSVTLRAPDGTAFGPVSLGGNLSFGAPNGDVAIFIGSRSRDPNNGDNMIGIWLAPGLSSGSFIVELETTDGPVQYHAWIEPHAVKSRQSRFASAVASHTLASVSTGRETVVVGAYDGHKTRQPIGWFSSTGPTRDGRMKPEVSAPGVDVMAAQSMTGYGVVRKSGTSMSAPAVTGLIALIYAEAKRKKKNLSIAQLRRQLLAHVSGSPPQPAGSNGWDPAYGFGRANGRSIKV